MSSNDDIRFFCLDLHRHENLISSPAWIDNISLGYHCSVYSYEKSTSGHTKAAIMWPLIEYPLEYINILLQQIPEETLNSQGQSAIGI